MSYTMGDLKGNETIVTMWGLSLINLTIKTSNADGTEAAQQPVDPLGQKMQAYPTSIEYSINWDYCCPTFMSYAIRGKDNLWIWL